MGQAKRRKEKGFMPEPSHKPHKAARRKVDPMDSIFQQSFMAMALAASMIARHKPQIFIREDDKHVKVR